MFIDFKLIICLVGLLPSLSYGINFVRVSENKTLAVYIDVDSIVEEGGYTTANQIKEYKAPMEFDKNNTFRSSLGLAEIDCKANSSRVAFLDTFELNGLKGKLISHGVKSPLITAIQPNTPTADVRDFLCSKNAPKKI